MVSVTHEIRDKLPLHYVAIWKNAAPFGGQAPETGSNRG